MGYYYTDIYAIISKNFNKQLITMIAKETVNYSL